MNGKPPLSVVIPSHSRPELLKACLHSVLRYAPQHTQIIVIDDGSAGATVTVAAREVAQCQVIRFEQSRGFCVAANTGIAAAQANLVQLLNDDAQLTSDPASAIDAFADPDVAAVAPLVLQRLTNRIDSAGDSYDRGGFAQPRGRGEIPAGKWLRPCDVDAVSACAAIYRRSAVLEVGGFPESFGAYFEDVDLSLRLRQAGYRIRYFPECQVRHWGSASYGRPQGKLITLQSRNEERVFWRNTNGTLAELFRHGMVLGGKALRRLTQGTLLPWGLGRLTAWTTEAKRALLSANPSNNW